MLRLKNLMFAYSDLLIPFFNQLNDSVIYVILRNYEDLPERVGNDLDILIEKKDVKKFEEILLSQKDKHWFILSKIPRQNLVTYILYTNYNSKPEYLKIDVALGISTFGICYISANAILENRKLYNFFYIPSPDDEFLVSFFQYFLYTGKVKAKNIQKLEVLFETSGEAIKSKINKLLTPSIGEIVESAVKHNNFTQLEKKYGYIKRHFLIRTIIKHPFISVGEIIKDFIRILSRIFHPTGIFLCFVGVDGSGKTTLINNTLEKLSYVMPDYKFYFSFRPEILPKLGETKALKSENENQDMRIVKNKWSGRFLSTLRLVYYSLDFILGYFLKIYPVLIKNGIVIGDRYFFDYFAHPERYNIQGNKNFKKILLRIIPKPNLTFFIKANPEIVITRKAELSVEEIEKQQEKFYKLKNLIKNYKIVENERNVQEAANLIEQQILTHLTDRISL